MGIEIGQALVRLAAESEGLKGDLDKAKGQTNSWAKNVGGVVKTAIGGAVLGGATIAIGAVASIGKAAFDMAGDHKSAQAEVRAQFGLTAEEAQRVADLARQSWGNNWGESIEDVSLAIGLVQQQLGELGVTSDQELQKASQDAIALRDTYGIEVNESIDAAKTLMEEFGLSSQEATDFIAAGFQQGLNRSGDFLDTITEYSLHFAGAGAEADQFFGFLESGLQGGMLGTDKAADAFKEFTVRIMDGSTTTADALEQLGFDSDEVINNLATGKQTVAGVWDDVTEALWNTDDAAVQMQAGVGLIGTQFEDLGVEAVLGLDLWAAGMSDINGATDALGEKYTSFPELFEASKRKVLVALAPISDTLLRVADKIMPSVTQGVERLAEIAGPIFETIGSVIESFISNLEEGMNPLDAFIEAIWDLAPPEVLDFLISLRDEVLPQLMSFFTNNIQPIIDFVAEFVSWKDILIILGGIIAATVIPAIIGIITSLAPIIAIVAAVIGVVALLRNAWENDWGGIRTKLIEVWEGTIKPALEVLWAWLSVNIPIAMEALRQFWVEVAWPAIQNAIEIVWPIIQNIFNSIVTFVTDTLIPTIRTLYEKWTTEWWPTIQTVLENVWTVIRGIFEELGRWINDNIVPWVEFLHETWVEKVWPAIQSAIETAWGIILPIWEKIREWLEIILPPIIEGLQTIFETVMSGISMAIQPVKDLWDTFVEAIKNFWDWIKNHTFKFKIKLPDLPEWATPGSPLPIHTAWKDFMDDMERLQTNLPEPAMIAAAQRTTNYNYYLTANYPYQDEGSLAQDIRTLQMLRS